MPYFGAGVDQHVNLAATPTWVFTPTPNAPATVRLVNEGSNVLYVGGAAVSPGNGLPLYPNTRVELPLANQTLYACSNYIASTVATTVTTASTAGAVAMTVGVAPVVGATLAIGNGAAKEIVTVAATSGTTIFTAATAFLYDHGVAATVATVTSVIAQLRVSAGVV